MKISFHVIVVALLFFPLFGQEDTAQSTVNSARLDSLIAIALQHNPEINMARYDSKAASTRVSVAGQLPDPQLTISAMNVPTNFTLNSDMMTMAPQISVMQMFPWLGKLNAASDVQEYGYKASTYKFSSTALEVVTNVRKAYGEIYRVEKTIRYLEYKEQLLQSVVNVAQQLFAVGQVPQQDVFRAAAELTMTQSDIIKMNGMLDDVNARLGALLGQSAPYPIRIDTLPLPSLPALDSLETVMEQQNPNLRQIHNVELAAQAKKVFAKKDAIPDVSVGVSYGYRGALMPYGTKALNMMNFEIGLSLPIFYGAKQGKMIEEAEAMDLAAQSQYSAADLALHSGLRSMYADASVQEKLIPLYSKQLVPQYEATYNSSLSSYSVGKTTFAMLIDNLTTLINTKIELVNIESAYFSASAEISKLAGEDAEQYRGEQ
jgi:cobalt-zinc-cadmium efflux system outer membrane protein